MTKFTNLETLSPQMQQQIAAMVASHTDLCTKRFLAKLNQTTEAISQLAAQMQALRVGQLQLHEMGWIGHDNKTTWPPAGLLGLGSMMITIGFISSLPERSHLYPSQTAAVTIIGGIIQLTVGILEANFNTFKKNSNERLLILSVFICFGSLWLGLGFTSALTNLPLFQSSKSVAICSIFAIWGFFCAALFIPALKISRAHCLLFATKSLAFFLLAWGELDAEASFTAGIVSILCGTCAIYTGMSIILNRIWRTGILPLGQHQEPPVIPMQKSSYCESILVN